MQKLSFILAILYQLVENYTELSLHHGNEPTLQSPALLSTVNSFVSKCISRHELSYQKNIITTYRLYGISGMDTK